MCFSAEADLAAAAVIAPIGVAALRRVRHRDEVLIAALPAAFALHQLVEAFVWWGVEGSVSTGVQEVATWAYLLFAQPILPVLVPVGMYFLEPDRERRRWLLPFPVVGVAVGAWLLAGMLEGPVRVEALDHALAYETGTDIGVALSVGYVVATCGPALLSTRPYLQAFGVANLVGVALAAIIRAEAFTSLWCVYAALVSVLILLHMLRRRADPAFA